LLRVVLRSGRKPGEQQEKQKTVFHMVPIFTSCKRKVLPLQP
jgi:hypothetical protein